MYRITDKDLDRLVMEINKLTNSPLSYCYEIGEVPFKSNIGHYHIDHAYSGVKLCCVTNEHGGISDVSQQGYGTKRELYNWMLAFIQGIHTEKFNQLFTIYSEDSL
jgi:hypothetical protein